jgi:hypothetical protein
MPISILFILKFNAYISYIPKKQEMIKINNPKTWLMVALIILMFAWMVIIIKRHREQNELQEKIYNHSEIIDTV